MASIGHLAVGLAAGRLSSGGALPRFTWTLALVGLSYLPDADVVAFRMGIPYQAPWGHRGAAHSLAVAGGCAVVVAVLAWLLRLSIPRVGATAFLVLASHGLLDALRYCK